MPTSGHWRYLHGSSRTKSPGITEQIIGLKLLQLAQIGRADHYLRCRHPGGTSCLACNACKRTRSRPRLNTRRVGRKVRASPGLHGQRVGPKMKAGRTKARCSSVQPAVQGVLPNMQAVSMKLVDQAIDSSKLTWHHKTMSWFEVASNSTNRAH